MVKFLLIASAALSTLTLYSSDSLPIVVPDKPPVSVEGYVLMDYYSGKVLAQKGMSSRMAPASLTKIMTSYIIGQELARGNISGDDDVIISENAWAKNFPDSSKMFIEVGTTAKVHQLNRGIIIQSGNDACVAMAEYIAGTEEAFVDLMNAWANSLGMKGTHYTNVHGLDHPNLYSTPYDLAILSRALILNMPNEYKIYSEKKFTYNSITQYNRNDLLWDKGINVDGIKTGHTNNAGYSLVSSASEGRMRLVTVVMGAGSPRLRTAETKKLLVYGFRFFETITQNRLEDIFIRERIWMGEKERVALGPDRTASVTLPRGQAEYLKTRFLTKKVIKAPIKRGEKVGEIFYQLDGECLAKYPLIALEDVKKGSIFSQLWDYITIIIRGMLWNGDIKP